MPASTSKAIEPFHSTLRGLFASLTPDLQGINACRYHRQISPGIQEYLEAVLFQHYLETERILPLADAAALQAGMVLTPDDYLLGLFDMTGELMRFAVTFLAANSWALATATAPSQSQSPARLRVLTDMQMLRAGFESLDAGASYALARDFDAKLRVARASVEKVELAFYSTLVRGRERPQGWRAELGSAEAVKEEDGAAD